MIENRLFLSRRNLETLLSKLDRKKAGEHTACSVIKFRNEQDPPEYQQTMARVTVVAVEDELYYVNRPAGAMHPADTPPDRHSTGTAVGLDIG